ncbi:hypothetical protein CKO23_02425 [Thiocystis violacea]|nr:hypothetical protein [Thiocystis violacea]
MGEDIHDPRTGRELIFGDILFFREQMSVFLDRVLVVVEKLGCFLNDFVPFVIYRLVIQPEPNYKPSVGNHAANFSHKMFVDFQQIAPFHTKG